MLNDTTIAWAAAPAQLSWLAELAKTQDGVNVLSQAVAGVFALILLRIQILQDEVTALKEQLTLEAKNPLGLLRPNQ